MPSAMAVKHLLTRQTDFYGAASDHREFTHNNFVIERIALASKTSAVRSGNHADTTSRHLQHFCHVPVQIVHILRGSPKCEFAVMAELGETRMLFQSKVSAAFIESDVFTSVIGLSKARLYTSEFVDLSSMDISELSMFVDARLRHGVRILDGCNCRQRFVFDVNQIESLGCNVFVHCRNGSHRIPDHPDFSDSQGVLILADGKSAIGSGQIRPHQNCVDTGVGFRFRNINTDDACMWDRTSQKFGVEHSWKHKIVCVFQFANALRLGIDLDQGFSDDAQTFSLASVSPSHKESPSRVRPARQPSAQPRAPQLPVF